MDSNKEHLLILAPMYNVTDMVFRQIIAACAPPDVFITEFVNVDGLQSAGRSKLLPYLYLEETDIPVWAQIWGSKPQNYYVTAQELVKMGFAGIDINMGCPDKTVIKNNNCSALIKPENRSLAAEIIAATKEGAHDLPVSVKTRLGFSDADLSWHEFLLKQEIACLSVHGRTTAQKSEVLADWQKISQIKRMAQKISPKTKIIGNGDIISRAQALQLCEDYGWDGAMIGRGVFSNPFVFAPKSPWEEMEPLSRVKLYLKHLDLFVKTYTHAERSFDPLKKFMKVYLTGFQYAQKLRIQVAECKNATSAIKVLNDYVVSQEKSKAF